MASPYQSFPSQTVPVRRHRRTVSIRRAKSTPTLSPGPHAPHWPPELDTEYLTRITAPPLARSPTNSSCALREDLLCGAAGSFQIVVEPPSPRGSMSTSSFASSSGTESSSGSGSGLSTPTSPTSARRRSKAKAAIRGAMDVVLGRLLGSQVCKTEDNLAFDLCT